MKKQFFKQLILILLIAVGTAGTGIGSGDEVPFSRFIKPITNPVFFDEPQNISYVHVVNAYQDLPKRINTTLGRVPLDGYLNLTAIRVTYALNQKFSLIAAKDGYIEFKPDNTLDSGYGWGYISLGFKGALYYCPQTECSPSASTWSSSAISIRMLGSPRAGAPEGRSVSWWGVADSRQHGPCASASPAARARVPPFGGHPKELYEHPVPRP